MIQDDKDLLLRDLCGRLPYRVKVSTYRFGDSKRTEVVETLYAIYQYDWSMETEEDDFARPIGKPYLFPLSSMNEEQKEELNNLTYESVAVSKDYFYDLCNCSKISTNEVINIVDWLNKNHFDYRGLIEKELAIDATNLGIYK